MNDQSKILIIDDEEIVRDSCTAILSGSDYQVQTAKNGSLGLDLLQEYLPDIVFVDLKMPGISGFEVLEGITNFDPTIVTIVITGFATVSSAVDAMKKGAFDFLPKPFTPDELRLITRRGLEKRNLILETIALRREREMMREHFAAIVSHELKSPLSAVQQNLIALTNDLSDVLNEEQKGRLEKSKSRLADLMKLIHTWLRVMSTDIDEIQTQFKPNSVDELVLKAIDNVQPHAIRKAIDIVPTLEEPMNPVLGDEGTLVEALTNIIGNAVKYSHLGSQIDVQAQEKDGEILISIADTGVGIPEEDIAHIFDDFYIAKSAPKDARGSGLGLAITRRIIEAHDGSVTVTSELGKGSIFLIKLPALSEVNT
jgi:two-component system sensor histidine kinase/response regulator